MKTYTKEQYLDWLFSQPDDRPLIMDMANYDGSKQNHKCGCIGVEFFRDHSKDETRTSFRTGFSGSTLQAVDDPSVVEAEIKDVNPFNDINCNANSKGALSVRNFGQAKIVMKRAYPQETAKYKQTIKNTW